MQRVNVLKHTWFGVVSFLLVGCGQPNYSAMKPSVVKPSVEVLVVNHPALWTSHDVQAVTSDNHVEFNVKYVTDSSVVSTLASDVQKLNQVSLFVIVGDGNIEQALSQVAVHHVQTRFDWFHTSPANPPIQALNLRSLRLNENLVSYATSWLAAEVAQSQGIQAPHVRLPQRLRN